MEFEQYIVSHCADRKKCPLHGPIIARDEAGIPPSKTSDLTAFSKQKMKYNMMNGSNSCCSSEDWVDPELSEDISVATGININVEKHRRGKGQGKCSKKKEKGLSNVAEMRNTPRARLEKKVFNPSAMKRVAEKMDVLESKKFKDKFADQFNYMFNK